MGSEEVLVGAELGDALALVLVRLWVHSGPHAWWGGVQCPGLAPSSCCLWAAAAAVYMIRLQILWARTHLFHSDLGERTGGLAPVPFPHPQPQQRVQCLYGKAFQLAGGTAHSELLVECPLNAWNWGRKAGKATHSLEQGRGFFRGRF